MIDGGQLPGDVAADVCVVGAGPAGIAVALELEASGLDVALVVGGGLDAHPRYQRLNRTRQVGLSTDIVERETVRGLGGTSSLWGGWCRPLDPLDFEERAEVPHSGWPFGLEALEAYYPRALELCGTTDPDADPPDPVLDHPALRRVFFRQTTPRRFGVDFRPDLARSPRLRTLLDLSALELESDADGKRIVAVRAATLGGRQTRLRARCFVLACGTIQTTRLLLCSRGRNPRGLGNEHDLVGRFFMQHPEHEATLLTFTREARRSMEGRDGMVAALTPSFVRQERLLSCHFLLHDQGVLEGSRPPGPLGRLREAWVHRRHLAARRAGDLTVARALSSFAHTFHGRDDQALVYSKLMVRPEQAPNSESRILIDDDDRDELGMPRAVMDWRLTPLDWRSAERSAQIVAMAVGAAGIGRVRPPDGTTGLPPPSRLNGGHHHFGTTKMNTDPRRGVVDADCRVHGIQNLFIASGSVFPTTGYANPMLTLLALAVRVARHVIDRRLARNISVAP